MSKIYCANCAFNDVEGQCSRPGGLLYGIRISDAMAEAEHDCTKFQEAFYRATPAGLLWLTMREAGVEADGGVAKQICDRFFERLIDAGMLKKEGPSDRGRGLPPPRADRGRGLPPPRVKQHNRK